MKGVYVLAVVVTVVLVLLIAGRLYTSNADFNIGNPYLNGFSKFYSGRDVGVLYHLSGLPATDARGTTLLIISPVYRYRLDDSTAIESYVERGGNLIIADDFGEADSLLKSLNTSTRIMQIPLYQNDKYYNSPSFPIITNVSDNSITAGVRQIYTNHPASLILDDRAVILASSSNKSWLDENGNGIIDKNENLSTFPIIARESYGSGSLTVIADPDVFSNDMIGKGDNMRLASNIFSENKVYVDLSHGPGIPLLMSAGNTIRYNIVAQILLIAAILLVSFIGFVVIRRFYRRLQEGYFESLQEEHGTVDLDDQMQSGQPDE